MTTITHPARGSIVVGLDRSDTGRRALGFALDTAGRLGVGCHVVHAWAYPTIALASPYAASACVTDLGPGEHDWLREVLDLVEHPDVVVTSQVVHSDAGTALVDVAAELDAAFLFVGSVGHNAIVGTLLGSISQYCVRHATCPVVVIPPADRVLHHGAKQVAASVGG